MNSPKFFAVRYVLVPTFSYFKLCLYYINFLSEFSICLVVKGMCFVDMSKQYTCVKGRCPSRRKGHILPCTVVFVLHYCLSVGIIRKYWFQYKKIAVILAYLQKVHRYLWGVFVAKLDLIIVYNYTKQKHLRCKESKAKSEAPVCSYLCKQLKSVISGGGPGPGTELFASNSVRSITYKFQQVQSLTLDVLQFEHN